VFGVISQRAGIDRAGWLFVAIGAVSAILMIVVLPQAPISVERASPTAAAAPEPTFPADRFVPLEDAVWPGHWATPPPEWRLQGGPVAGLEALQQARAAIADFPAALRQVIVLRDVEG